MTGTKTKDKDGEEHVKVSMPFMHWMGLLAALGLGGWNYFDKEANPAQHVAAPANDPAPVSREWAKKLSTDMDSIGVKLEKLVKHEAEIDGVHKRLDRIEDSLDELKRRN